MTELLATLKLMAISAVITIGLGITAGVYCGIQPKSWAAKTILSSSLAGVSLPTFVIGIALIYLFAVTFSAMPCAIRWCR